MKLYELKPWTKVRFDWKTYQFLKIDWMYGKWLDENWEFVIAFFAWEDMDEYLVWNEE